MEFTAFLQLCAASPWAHRLRRPLSWCTPLGTRLYRLVSHHRRSAWRLLNALRGKPVAIGARLQQACAATAILLMLVGAWHTNLAAVSGSFRQATESFGNRLRHLGLQQRWMVFSPMPMVNDGCSCPASPPPPRNVSSNPFRSGRVYRNQRQRKFILNLAKPEHAKAAAAYVRDACRQLSARPGLRPSQLELVWMQETSQPPPLPPKPVVAVPRLRQSCG